MMDYLFVNTWDIMDWDNDVAEYMALEMYGEVDDYHYFDIYGHFPQTNNLGEE